CLEGPRDDFVRGVVTAERVDRDARQLPAGEAERLDLAALVGAAGRADAVRLLGRTALRAGREARRPDRGRGAPLVAAGLRLLPLWDGHGGAGVPAPTSAGLS